MNNLGCDYESERQPNPKNFRDPCQDRYEAHCEDGGVMGTMVGAMKSVEAIRASGLSLRDSAIMFVAPNPTERMLVEIDLEFDFGDAFELPSGSYGIGNFDFDSAIEGYVAGDIDSEIDDFVDDFAD